MQDPAFLEELLRQGTLGLVIVAFVTGFFVPKYVLVERDRRIKHLRRILNRQRLIIERLAAKAAGIELPPEDSESEDDDA